MVFLDGLYAGMLKDDRLQLNAPRGKYELKVQFGGRVPIGKSGRSIDMSVSSTKPIEVPSTGDVEYVFHDRERLWNLLFDIDLIVVDCVLQVRIGDVPGVLFGITCDHLPL